MATVNPYGVERRHTPDRRVNGRTSALSVVDWVALTLLVIGGVNWGLVGLFNFDLVAALFGAMSPLSRIIYVLVGLSALYTLFTATKLSNRT